MPMPNNIAVRITPLTSVTVRTAPRVPTAVGVNTTATAQEDPGATEVPVQASVTIEKSDTSPDSSATRAIDTGTVPAARNPTALGSVDVAYAVSSNVIDSGAAANREAETVATECRNPAATDATS